MARTLALILTLTPVGGVRRPKLFFLGPGSTGTRFFTHVLRSWKYYTLHWRCTRHPDVAWSEVFNTSSPCFQRDAFLDAGEAADVDWLLRNFPDARYVLNTRPVGTWTASRVEHLLRSRGKAHLRKRCNRGHASACEAKPKSSYADFAPELPCDERNIADIVVHEARHQQVRLLAGALPREPHPHPLPTHWTTKLLRKWSACSARLRTCGADLLLCHWRAWESAKRRGTWARLSARPGEGLISGVPHHAQALTVGDSTQYYGPRGWD